MQFGDFPSIALAFQAMARKLLKNIFKGEKAKICKVILNSQSFSTDTNFAIIRNLCMHLHLIKNKFNYLMVQRTEDDAYL
jgi:hypothetical protein